MGLFNFRSTPKDRVIGILNTSSEIIFDNGFKDVVSGAKLNVQTVNLHAQYYFECQIVALTLIALHYQQQFNISTGLDDILKASNPLRKTFIDLANIGAKTSIILSNCRQLDETSRYNDVQSVLAYILYERYYYYDTILTLLLYRNKSDFDYELEYEGMYELQINQLYKLSHNPYMKKLQIGRPQFTFDNIPSQYIDMLHACQTAQLIIENSL